MPSLPRPSPSLISPIPHSIPKNAPHHHPSQKSKLLVLPIKDNAKEPSFHGTLLLKQTPKGARVGKLRIQQREKEDFRVPEELIYL